MGHYRGLLNGRERKESRSRAMQGETDMAGFEDGKELWAKDMWAPPEAEKGQENKFSPWTSRRNSALQTP